MNEILSEWERYCEGDWDVDKSHFLGLFKSGLTDQELRRALRFFSHSDHIEQRIRAALGAGHLGEYAYLQRPTMKDAHRTKVLAQAWLDEQAKFCHELGEADLQHIAQSAEVAFVDRAEYDRIPCEDNPGSWIRGHIADKVFMPLMGSPRTTFALIEAAYGIAADTCLGWYITQPLLKINLHFSKYFDFWRSGGTGVLTRDRFLILKDE